MPHPIHCNCQLCTDEESLRQQIKKKNRPMTRNDFIRRAISVMAQDDTGAELAKIFLAVVPGLNENNISRDSVGLKQEVKDTIQAIRQQLRRLSEELKAIDSE